MYVLYTQWYVACVCYSRGFLSIIHAPDLVIFTRNTRLSTPISLLTRHTQSISLMLFLYITFSLYPSPILLDNAHLSFWSPVSEYKGGKVIQNYLCCLVVCWPFSIFTFLDICEYSIFLHAVSWFESIEDRITCHMELNSRNWSDLILF